MKHHYNRHFAEGTLRHREHMHSNQKDMDRSHIHTHTQTQRTDLWYFVCVLATGSWKTGTMAVLSV